MHYLITFLEGFSSFISPCILPMLPVYVSYFAGDRENDGKTFVNALFFVAGFSVIYMLLGLFAGTIGRLLTSYRPYVNLISGAVVMFFGLGFLGVFNLTFLNGRKTARKIKSIFESFVFGVVFSVGITPCVGAFLGSALMLASNRGSLAEGALLLFVYSLGLGIPFLLCAAFISSLKGSFDFIKRHYRAINTISGVLLILVGLGMAFGLFNNLSFGV